MITFILLHSFALGQIPRGTSPHHAHIGMGFIDKSSFAYRKMGGNGNVIRQHGGVKHGDVMEGPMVLGRWILGRVIHQVHERKAGYRHENILRV
jgi:hypothetical protein